MEVNSNMALAANVAGEHLVCSSICNFRSLPDRRVPFNSKQGLLSSVTGPRGFVFVSVMAYTEMNTLSICVSVSLCVCLIT